MRLKSALLSAAALAGFAPGVISAELPVTFRLQSSANAVAVQFDVTSAVPGSSMGQPQLTGVSTHRIESMVLSSGARRFLVYSTAGEPISPGGSISVAFELLAEQLQNGILTISGVVASDGTGNAVPATPGAVPVITGITPAAGETALIGRSIPVAVEAVDLDGSVSAVSFLVDQAPFGADATPPFAAEIPAALALPHDRTVVAEVQDNQGETARSPAITLRFRDPAALTTFEAFQNAWFGSTELPSAAFGNDPFGTGIPNYLAWALGFDPRSPDWSRLPELETEGSGAGRMLVFRVRTLAHGVVYQVLASPSLAPADDWAPVPAPDITESLEAGGWRLIEARVPEPSDHRKFFKLDIQEP